MYLIQCVNAYEAVLAMSREEHSYKLAYAIATLKRRLQPHVDFFTRSEYKLVEEYAQRDENGKVILNENGSFNFIDPNKAGEYEGRRGELGMMEVNEAIEILVAPPPETIKPVYLEALDGFIEFEDIGGAE